MAGEPAALTVEQVRAAVSKFGPSATDDGWAHCPLHDPYHTVVDRTLHITQNGDGAHLECTAGCDAQAIGGMLRAALTFDPTPQASQANPFEDARTILEQLAPDNLAGLERIVIYGEDGDVVELQFEGGRSLDIGPRERLARQDHFLRCVARAGAFPDPLQAKNYRAFMRMVMAAAEHREGAGPISEEIHEWVDAYARQNGTTNRHLDLADTAQKLQAITYAEQGQPFRDNVGHVHVRAAGLARWLKRMDIANVAARDVANRLSRLGLHSRQLSARDDRGEIHKARVWAVPQDHVPAVPASIREGNDAFSSRGDSGYSGDTYIGSGNAEAVRGDDHGDNGTAGGSR